MRTTEILGQEEYLTGREVKMEQLIGRTITVLDFRILESKYNKGHYAIVQAEMDGDTITFTTTSVQLVHLKKIPKEDFPKDFIIATSRTGHIRFETSWICENCNTKNTDWRTVCKRCKNAR